MKCKCGFRSVSKSTMCAHVRTCYVARRSIAESSSNAYTMNSSADSILTDALILNLFTSSSYSDFSSSDSFSGGGGFGGGGSSSSWSDSGSSSSDCGGGCGGCD